MNKHKIFFKERYNKNTSGGDSFLGIEKYFIRYSGGIIKKKETASVILLFFILVVFFLNYFFFFTEEEIDEKYIFKPETEIPDDVNHINSNQ